MSGATVKNTGCLAGKPPAMRANGGHATTRRLAVLRSHLSSSAEVAAQVVVPTARNTVASGDRIEADDSDDDISDDDVLGTGDADGDSSIAADSDPAVAAASGGGEVGNAIADPFSRAEATTWNGWGFEDTEFFANEKGQVCLSGDRYAECFEGARVMPKFRAWIEETFKGFDFNEQSPSRTAHFTPPPPRPFGAFEDALAAASSDGGLRLVTTDVERVTHGHGQTNSEVYVFVVRSVIVVHVCACVCVCVRMCVHVCVHVCLSVCVCVCVARHGGGHYTP